MQLLVRYTFPDRDAWSRQYESHAEARAGAGLRQLQLWTEGSGNVWALYDVSDRGDADDHLDGLAKLEGEVAERHYLQRF